MKESLPIWMRHVTSRMDESRTVWMSHVTCEWVTSYMNELHYIRTSHVPYEWVMSHANESCHISMCEPCHIWMSHVTYVIYEWGMSHINALCHIWMSAGILSMNESEWVKSFIWMRNVTHERVHVHHHTYKRAAERTLRSHHLWMRSRHTWMSNVTYEWVVSHMNESHNIWVRAGVPSHVQARCRAHVEVLSTLPTTCWDWCVSCVTRFIDMTWFIHIWRDSSICDMTHPCVTWLIHVWHDSSMCDMTHPCVTWLAHM